MEEISKALQEVGHLSAEAAEQCAKAFAAKHYTLEGIRNDENFEELCQDVQVTERSWKEAIKRIRSKPAAEGNPSIKNAGIVGNDAKVDRLNVGGRHETHEYRDQASKYNVRHAGAVGDNSSWSGDMHADKKK